MGLRRLVNDDPVAGFALVVVGVGCLLCALVFALMVVSGQAKLETREDLERRQASMEYLKTFRVVRVCPVAPEAFGQFVMQGSDGRFWLSAYARPARWSQVAALGDVQPEQVC